MEGNRSGTTFKIYITKYIPLLRGDSVHTLLLLLLLSHRTPTSILLEKEKNGSVGFSLPPTSRLSNGDRSGSCAGRVICSSEKSQRLSGFAVGREKIE